ncbi:NAD(P)H-hydrate dehydratase [Henriciella sp. AS95]|uniref:NAD(P)H-hydrate dehydratase n=1 Tax=Henriciella sp. AS95 TaxID=3135782 RepID=UPI00319E1123
MEGHKYGRGHLGCVTGPTAATGAARLTARAGLRIGAGLVSLLSPPASVLVNATHATAVMVKPFQNEEELAALTAQMDCVVIGPGAGVSGTTARNVETVLDHAASAVLDADALTVFKDQPEHLFKRLQKPAILTPHEGEFERLFAGLLKDKGRELAAIEAAQKSGATIILKGAETIIASPDERPVINRHASPFLATAGSGDVLAGVVGGLMSQGMTSFDAACAGVWVHGEAGRNFGPGLIAEDLPEALPAILSRFYELRS